MADHEVFRRWRRSRPFWGGAWVIAGGVAILLAPLAPLPLIVHQGIAGVSGYLVGLLLVAIGVLSWLQPGQHVFFGVVATLLSLASFVTSNFGGFGVGMILGLTGGALLSAWLPAKPSRHRPEAAPTVRGALSTLPVALAMSLPGSAPAPPVFVASTAASGLSAERLTMTGARFGGVVTHPTADGPRRYLRLLAHSVRISGGEQWSRHLGVTTRQEVPAMTMRGGVVLHLTRLKARAFGVRLACAPGSPPPSLPPHLTVTDLDAAGLLVEADHLRISGLGQTSSTLAPRPER